MGVLVLDGENQVSLLKRGLSEGVLTEEPSEQGERGDGKAQPAAAEGAFHGVGGGIGLHGSVGANDR